MKDLRSSTVDSLRYYLLDYMEHSCVAISARRKKWLADALANFCLDTSDKFVKGQEEHAGQDFGTCDVEKELYAEVIDIFVYRAEIARRIENGKLK